MKLCCACPSMNWQIESRIAYEREKDLMQVHYLLSFQQLSFVLTVEIFSCPPLHKIAMQGYDL